MHDDESPVERLNDTLYSRTEYKPPEDRRSVIHGEEAPEAPKSWNSPEIDQMIAARKEEEKPSRLKHFFLFSIVVFLIALGVAGYVFYGGSNFISTKNVDIQVTGPAVIEAGEPLTLMATVENNNNAPLEDAILSIQYPDGTRTTDDHSTALTYDKVTLGEVKAGAESVQTFRSALYGQKGDTETLKLTLEYKVQGSNATFYKDKTFDVTIGDTPLLISIEHPTSVTSGEAYDTKIVVASNSSDTLKNVVVRAEYPYGYSLTSADPAPISNGNFWSIGDLAPGDKKTITLHGVVTGVDAEERTFRYYAGIPDPNNPTSLQNALVSTTDTIQITRPSVGFDISIDGNTEGDYIAPMGATVNAVIQYQNNSSDKLTNTRITARITGSVDKTTIRPSEGGFYDSNTGLVTWEAPGVPSLAAVAPGDSGSVFVSFASPSSLPAGKSQSIDIAATIDGTPNGVASADQTTNSASRTVKISSTVNFSGKALYSRGPYKNVGPIPPKAEATTTYTVALDLGNTQNDVGSATVTAQLGPNVHFVDGGSGADAVTYDPASNTLTWNVGTLASGAGFSGPLREAVFQVALKPSIGQIGTSPTLVSGLTFSGTDTFTKLPVTSSIPAITTRLTSDSAFVQGDDIVVK